MADRLRIDFINSLPQPFMVIFYGGDDWPLYDIDVETGCMRIDVCGKLQVKHIRDVRKFIDADGVSHSPESFYIDDEEYSVS